MSSYFLSFPQILQDGKDLFPREQQHVPFYVTLYKLILKNTHEYSHIIVCHQYIGTHSVGKGAATYCCAGFHPRPSYENAGDELVGRTLTSIP